VAEIGRASITYEGEIIRRGEVVARGHSTSACCEVGPGCKMRAIPVPIEVSEKLRPYLVRMPQASRRASRANVEDHRP
jgi:acyl-CoA thioesterase FadM